MNTIMMEEYTPTRRGTTKMNTFIRRGKKLVKIPIKGGSPLLGEEKIWLETLLYRYSGFRRRMERRRRKRTTSFSFVLRARARSRRGPF